MAATYTYQHVLSMLQKSIPRVDEAIFATNICNLATHAIWNSYDWRESLEELPPFFTIPGEQDHHAPTTSVPSDFHGLRKASIVQLSAPSFWERTIRVAKDLEETHQVDIPHAIAYEPSVSGFRLFPRVPVSVGAPTWLIKGTYKKRAPQVTSATLSTTTLFSDDDYIGVWVEAILWAAKKLSGAADAGEVTINSGQKICTGQLARMRAAIDDMATNEGIQDGDPIIAPGEAFAPGFNSGWGYGPY